MGKCWIYGDESGQLGKDRFFAIGVVGTEYPQKADKVLKELREKTNFQGEVSYKSSDNRRALCAVRWIDWIFSDQDIVKFKIVIKDRKKFKLSYFKNNSFGISAESLAYCQTYKEVLNNFAKFSNHEKVFVYSQKSLEKFDIPKFLEGKVAGLSQDRCYSGNPKEKKPYDKEYTLNAEFLQLCDLLSSSVRGLTNAINSDGVNKCWVKRMIQRNLVYHLPRITDNLKMEQSVYHPSYQLQKFVIFYWKPRNA